MTPCLNHLKGETIWTILNHLGLKPFEMFFIEYCIDFKKYYSIILFMNPFYTIMNFLLYLIFTALLCRCPVSWFRLFPRGRKQGTKIKVLEKLKSVAEMK